MNGRTVWERLRLAGASAEMAALAALAVTTPACLTLDDRPFDNPWDPTADYDRDGIANSDDPCPADPLNRCPNAGWQPAAADAGRDSGPGAVADARPDAAADGAAPRDFGAPDALPDAALARDVPAPDVPPPPPDAVPADGGPPSDVAGQPDVGPLCHGQTMSDAPVCLTLGVCAGTVPTCGARGWVCTYPDTHAPGAEVDCDGFDNDCDGQTDEDYVPDASCGVGACRTHNTASSCAGGHESACVPGAPAGEVCGNGIDEDCDGTPDDGCGGCVPGPVNPGAAVADRWAKVCPGTFTMGSPGPECPNGACADPRCPPGPGCPQPEPGRIPWADNEFQHSVTITRAFEIKATEVTQDEWLAAFGSNPSYFRAGGSGGCAGDVPCGNRPVEEVNWYEAAAYCNWLSEHGREAPLEKCYQDQGGADYDAADAAAADTPRLKAAGLGCLGYRLPTEAEWEYAARAGTFTAFSTGEIVNTACNPLDAAMDRAGWYCGNSGNRTHPVGTKAANAWGIYDMHGNVWEWVWDAYVTDHRTVNGPDPRSDGQAGLYRVVRGGSWGNYARSCRAASRNGVDPGGRYDDLGFRPSRTTP